MRQVQGADYFFAGCGIAGGAEGWRLRRVRVASAGSAGLAALVVAGAAAGFVVVAFTSTGLAAGFAFATGLATGGVVGYVAGATALVAAFTVVLGFGAAFFGSALDGAALTFAVGSGFDFSVSTLAGFEAGLRVAAGFGAAFLRVQPLFWQRLLAFLQVSLRRPSLLAQLFSGCSLVRRSALCLSVSPRADW